MLNSAIHIFAYIAVGFLLDWAACGQLTISIISLSRRSPVTYYRDHIFPRCIFSLIGLGAIACATLGDTINENVLLAGALLAAASSLYGLVAIFRRSEPFNT